MPKTRLIAVEVFGSTQGCRPGRRAQTASKAAGSTTFLRSSSSISGTHRVMEKQPLSPGKTPNFRYSRSPVTGLSVRSGSATPSFSR